MSDLQLDQEAALQAITINADSVCHIDDGSGVKALCGRATPEGMTCPHYNGEAICLGCGRVNCPKCIELCGLRDRLADD